jgi:hypothetical protein
MVQLSSDDIAKSVIAAHGAIHLITLALVEKKAISDEKALAALKILEPSNAASAKILAESIEMLERLVSLNSK